MDEKFGFKEIIFNYNYDEEEADPKTIIENVEFFFETDNYLGNNVQVIEQRVEPRYKSRE